jgi:hypothetical protein
LAVVDVHAGFEKTYRELREDVAQSAATLCHADKALSVLAARNRYDSLVLYLAALSSGQTLMMVDPSLNQDLLRPLLDTYRPDYVHGNFTTDGFPGYRKIGQIAPDCWERETKRPNSDPCFPLPPFEHFGLNWQPQTGPTQPRESASQRQFYCHLPEAEAKRARHHFFAHVLFLRTFGRKQPSPGGCDPGAQRARNFAE